MGQKWRGAGIHRSATGFGVQLGAVIDVGGIQVDIAIMQANCPPLKWAV